MKVFISYASEDALIASAVEGAFNSLMADGSVNIDVYRDIHTFQQGRPLKEQILEELRKADILFVIYSKTLKRSHSYTGFEIGAFSAFMDLESKQPSKPERSIVSLFLDDPPATERDVLGIKLNLDALRPTADGAVQSLGLSGDFARFLGDMSDRIYDKQPPQQTDGESLEHYITRVKKLKDSKRTFIKKKVIPRMESDLRVALSSIVARFSIEQKFIQLSWAPTKSASVARLVDDVVVNAGDSEVLKIFGVSDKGDQMTWGGLRKSILEAGPDCAPYFINALEYVVSSTLSSAPIDNDQVILANDRTPYRVIVTRHYAYFDGGRTMHVYFIPMLTDRTSGPASLALALLRLATRFRMMFLVQGAPLSIDAFEINKTNLAVFKSKVQQFARETLFTAGQSHTNQLDDPINFYSFFEASDRPDNNSIAKLYGDWKTETEKILSVAASMDSASDMPAFASKWTASLREYINFVAPINRQIGAEAAERLLAWYKKDDQK